MLPVCYQGLGRCFHGNVIMDLRFPLDRPSPRLTLDPRFGRLQRENPVAHIDYNGAPAWLITRYEDARFVLSSPELFSRSEAEARNTGSMRPDGFLTDMDGPDHHRHRTLI